MLQYRGKSNLLHFDLFLEELLKDLSPDFPPAILGQQNRKTGSLPLLTRYLDRSPLLLDDPMSRCKIDPGPIRLGREKGVEDLSEVPLGDAATRIGDLYANEVPLGK